MKIWKKYLSLNKLDIPNNIDFVNQPLFPFKIQIIQFKPEHTYTISLQKPRQKHNIFTIEPDSATPSHFVQTPLISTSSE